MKVNLKLLLGVIAASEKQCCQSSDLKNKKAPSPQTNSTLIDSNPLSTETHSQAFSEGNSNIITNDQSKDIYGENVVNDDNDSKSKSCVYKDNIENSNNPRLNLIIIGSPGSGKGTQSKLIAKKYSLAHISTGEILREELMKKTLLGDLIKNGLEDGGLVPDYLVNACLLQHVPARNFILDGYPRKISQIDLITDIDLVLHLDITEEEAIKRIMGRKQGRTDDNEATVRKRLTVYNEITKPVLNFYASKNNLVGVNAFGTQEEVFERLVDAIEEYKKNF